MADIASQECISIGSRPHESRNMPSGMAWNIQDHKTSIAEVVMSLVPANLVGVTERSLEPGIRALNKLHLGLAN